MNHNGSSKKYFLIAFEESDDARSYLRGSSLVLIHVADLCWSIVELSLLNVFVMPR